MNKLEPLSMTTIYSGIPDDLTTTAYLKANVGSVSVKAVWDTGANRSSIPMIAAFSLGLESKGVVQVNDGSGTRFVDTFDVDIELDNGIVFRNIRVVASSIHKHGLGLLIGWDVISRGDFSIVHTDGNTVLTFTVPSLD